MLNAYLAMLQNNGCSLNQKLPSALHYIHTVHHFHEVLMSIWLY